jgi:CheY-like chemotaxis protein
VYGCPICQGFGEPFGSPPEREARTDKMGLYAESLSDYFRVLQRSVSSPHIFCGSIAKDGWGQFIGGCSLRPIFCPPPFLADPTPASSLNNSRIAARIVSCPIDVLERSQKRKALMTARKQVPVLIIDDETNIAKTLAMVLEQEGHAATFALSGQSGIEIASRIGPHVAIVDLNLPDIDGIKTAVEICKRVPDCKILLMTGDPDSVPKLEEARAKGINFEVVGKPIPPKELLQRLAELLR